MKRFFYLTLFVFYTSLTILAQTFCHQNIIGTWEMHKKNGIIHYSFDHQGRAALKFIVRNNMNEFGHFDGVLYVPGTTKLMGKALSVNFNENEMTGDFEFVPSPEAVEKAKTDSKYRAAMDYLKKTISSMDKESMIRELKSSASSMIVPHYMQITYCKGKTLVLNDPRQGRMEFTYIGPADLSPKKNTSVAKVPNKKNSSNSSAKPVQSKANRIKKR